VGCTEAPTQRSVPASQPPAEQERPPDWPLNQTVSDPPNTVLHQLDAQAWERSLTDLLGVQGDWAGGFPVPDRGDGFSNAAATQHASSGLLDAMYEAATTAVALALADPVADEVVGDGGVWRGATDGQLQLGQAATLALSAPLDGRYRAELVGTLSSDAPSFGTVEAEVSLRLGETDTAPVVREANDESRVYTAEADLEAGTRMLRVELQSEETSYHITLSLDRVVLVGPFAGQDVAWGDVRRCRAADGSEGEACARETVEHLARRAWRRELTSDELDALLGLYVDGRALGDSWIEATTTALVAALLAPDFLYRLEPRVPITGMARRVALGPHALAARMAHFLWSSVPDEALWTAAAEGELDTDAGRAAQVERMLDDPRSEVLVERFWLEWLHAERIDEAARLPPYDTVLDDGLRTAAAAELRQFGREMLFGDRGIGDLMRMDTLWVDDRLAAHYGITPPGASVLVPVSASSAEGPPRIGLLGRAGLYIALSGQDSTRPTHRGSTLMTQLLCIEPPPPPDADLVQAGLEEEEGLTPQEIMEKHISDPVCASCHQLMDPVGYALESYDPNGAYRSHYPDGLAIPQHGVLHTGATFGDVAELSELLADDPALSRCATQQLYAWALGRTPELGDWVELEGIEAAAEGSGLRATIGAIVASEAFRTQRTLDPEER
jgi:hypothetical protein